MSSLEMSWAALLDDIDRIASELPYIFFATCPDSDDEVCMVVDDDEFEPDEDVPAVAQMRGFTHGLLVDDVQQVVENLRQQDPVVRRDVLLRAIAYYVEQDAFIDLSNWPGAHNHAATRSRICGIIDNVPNEIALADGGQIELPGTGDGYISAVVCRDADGSIAWNAFPPEGDRDAWVSASLVDGVLIAKSWSGWRIELDPASGVERTRTFTK